jgi:hypothetical protein
MPQKNKFKNYKLLKPTNILRKGDQLYDWVTRGWYNVPEWERGMPPVSRARRPLSKAPKYYYLKEGDIVQSGDEWNFDDTWELWTDAAGESLESFNVGRCRRTVR